MLRAWHAAVPRNRASQKVKIVAKRSARSEQDTIIIKKYANRRLYNTATSSYVTLDHLAEMVKKGQDFVVHDAKTGEDITRSVLTQIIFEEEGKGQNLLPINFLRQLIGFYGDNLQTFVPTYLEMTMAAFAKEQEKLRDRMTATLSGRSQMEQFEEQMRQNLAMFDSAMKVFSPFSPLSKGGTAKADSPHPNQIAESLEQQARTEERSQEIDELKQQVAEMQAMLRQISSKGDENNGDK